MKFWEIKNCMKTLLVSLLVSILTALNVAIAANYSQISQPFIEVDEPELTVIEEPIEIQEVVDCRANIPENASYGARFLTVRKKGKVGLSELFETKVYFQNTGNVPWFSGNSGCKHLNVFLGTEKARDRSSIFYTDNLMWHSNWSSANRIFMDNNRVDPGDIASFTYWSVSPSQAGIYREYFAPVMEGVTWMNSGLFYTDINVGNPEFDPARRDFLRYIEESRELTSLNLNGEKSIEVDISEQRMKFKIGDYVIKDFPTSTGAYRTPTPFGTTRILYKQEVRVAHKWPHYIMPKWMAFRPGYGIHALPSISWDNGYYWTEALNHIGTRISHGCMRLLPQDAEWAFNFTDVGTTVYIHN